MSVGLFILPLMQRRGASRLEPGIIKRIIVNWAWGSRQLPWSPRPLDALEILIPPARRKPPLVGHNSRRTVRKVGHGSSSLPLSILLCGSPSHRYPNGLRGRRALSLRLLPPWKSAKGKKKKARNAGIRKRDGSTGSLGVPASVDPKGQPREKPATGISLDTGHQKMIKIQGIHGTAAAAWIPKERSTGLWQRSPPSLNCRVPVRRASNVAFF